MKLFVLFGLPGAGKTFVGKLFEEHFGFYLYDGDQDMSQILKKTILEQRVVTDQMRDTFFNKLIVSVKNLQKHHEKIVVTQTFIKEKYREQFLQAFPQARFVLIESPVALREKRLGEKKDWQLELSYWRKMAGLFEEPQIEYRIIENNSEGEEHLKKQIQLLVT